jgi:hypothetical protein
MRNNSVICVYWKITGRLEVFSNLGKLYSKYESSILGVSKWTLHRKKLLDGWENEFVKIQKVIPN